jgi:hypothetical protein
MVTIIVTGISSFIKIKELPGIFPAVYRNEPGQPPENCLTAPVQYGRIS